MLEDGKMKNNTKRMLLRAGASVTSLVMVLSVTGTYLAEANASKVHSALGTSSVKLVSDGETGDTEYFKSDYSSWEDEYEHAKQVNMDVQEEGSVLLENDGTLPLKKAANVSLFSWSSANIVYGGTGSGGIDTSKAPDLKTAMEEEGFNVNPVLWNYYKGIEKPEDTSDQDTISPQFSSSVFEPSVDEYSQEVLDSYKEYGDAAIVVLSRTGGEGSDLDVTNQYLELQQSEKELLSHVQENFDKVIVLLNSSNALAMGWVDDYDVDSVLWIGGPGQEGLRTVAKMLDGEKTPSGKLADTYAANSLSSPAMQNFGEYLYSNVEFVDQQIDTKNFVFTNDVGESIPIKNAGAYVVEAEGIYVGYKYYETRYEDTVLKQGNADGSAGVFASADNKWNYADEVSYPFGYGLSYTTFEQKLDSVECNGDKAVIKVSVTNTGDTYSGKDVVEVYEQAPYIDGGVEKASVQLCGFAKTDVLAPGESQQLIVEVDMQDIASYDYQNDKTYVLDAGDYYFAIGNGAHEAINNILAAKGKTVDDGMDQDGDADKAGKYELEEKRLVSTDKYSGNEVTNLFEDADLNHYYDAEVTYLSRSDWQNTWPKTYSDIKANDEMIEDLENNYTAVDAGTEEPITYGEDNGIALVSLREADFDDPKWDELLNQMTLDEQIELVSNGLEQTAPVMSIGFTGTNDSDGPGGLTGRKYLTDPKDDGSATDTLAVGYNSSVVIASTWNSDMAYQRGASVGEDGLWTSTEGWWGPGANTHRTPYSGRNFEYYSEDAFLGGTIGANDVSGALSKGLRSYFKHFAANDQEAQRHGISTFANEQALREIYFKQFQKVVQEGKTVSLMESFNRIGCTWAGGDYALCTELLRNEWGFEGNVETDLNFADPEGWMNFRSGLAGGTDQWLLVGQGNLKDYVEDDLNLAYEIRNACHRILYAASRTSAMNGMYENVKVVSVKAWWETTLFAVDIISAVLSLLLYIMIIKEDYTKKKVITAKGDNKHE